MAKPPEFVGEARIHLLVGSEYQDVTVPVVAFVGPLAVHTTVADHRLAEAKTDAWSVSHATIGLGVINGMQTRKVALEFAAAALEKAQELGLELNVGTLEALQSQPEYAPWLAWALPARSESKTRKGFLYG